MATNPSTTNMNSNSVPLGVRNQWEQEWASLHVDAWINVVFQVLRVFVLQRVTLKQYKNLSGVAFNPTLGSHNNEFGTTSELKAADSAMSGSNVFSLAESTLLRWMSLHANLSTASAVPVWLTNFDKDLEDGTALCQLVASHIPSMAQHGGPMNG